MCENYLAKKEKKLNLKFLVDVFLFKTVLTDCFIIFYDTGLAFSIASGEEVPKRFAYFSRLLKTQCKGIYKYDRYFLSTSTNHESHNLQTGLLNNRI